MTLSLWQCDAVGCKRTCTGTGGPVGLRAIGWYWKPDDIAPALFCPEHRPDKTDCKQRPGTPCSLCAAEQDARDYQPKLMTNPELDHYVRDILPALQRMDLYLAVCIADGRPLPAAVDHHRPRPLCEHGVWQLGGCKNADCHNCTDNLIPDQGPLAPPEYRPHMVTMPSGPARCAACELCTDGQPCRNADSCPLLWCACHVDQALRELEERPAQCCERCPCTGAKDQPACDPCCVCHKSRAAAE